MAFRDLPVIRAGISRFARITNCDAAFESFEVDSKAFAANAFGAKMDGRDPAVLAE